MKLDFEKNDIIYVEFNNHSNTVYPSGFYKVHSIDNHDFPVNLIVLQGPVKPKPFVDDYDYCCEIHEVKFKIDESSKLLRLMMK